MVQPKYQKIAETLREAIDRGDFAPGNKVPSVAELQKQYGVSHVTVMTAYQILVKSRHIENFSGRGYFVCKPIERKQNRLKNVIGFGFRPLSDHPGDRYFNRITHGIQQTCIRYRFDWFQPYSSLLFNCKVFDYQNLPEVKDVFRKMAEKVDAFIVDERLPDDVIQEIYEDVRMPMVLLNRRTGLDFLDCVYPPVGEALGEALDLALKLEYENFILCITDCPRPFSLNEMLREEFSSFLRKNRIPPERAAVIPDCNLVPNEETFAAAMRENSKMPAGKTLFITDVALFFYPHLLNEGRHPGKDCGLLAVYDIAAVREHVPPFSALQMKPFVLGEMAVEVLFQRLHGAGQPCRVHMPKAEMLIGKTL